MGRTTWFYKLNAEKAKSNLILDLHSRTKFKKSFEDFINERKAEFGDDFDVTFNDVIQKVSSNINTIRPNELWELTYWLDENKYERTGQGENYEKVYTELYTNNGIESLYEIQSINAYGFMFQYGNFTDYFEIDETDEPYDGGRNVNAKKFTRFLDYMILLMKKVSEADLNENEYKYEPFNEEVEEISKIENLNQENKLLFEIIENEFISLKRNFFKEKEKENLEENYRSRNPDYYTVFCAEGFLENCIRMKREIEEINTNILIVDSM
ncbi:hypothetical protein [Flavobacterium sp. LC2016-01]|uniref:hypothetical protein n=1 Tax=Flavobacterium sp. LC2016-01 TaxID=2675876 RepID=UPI0012BB1911|nr:hypothetical protein [Flavobacterium sp. LC2016-01]MTH16288.1 hypothetical protein [Flavobacterium sp. LC2016-01]